jgi:hypothetical protein
VGTKPGGYRVVVVLIVVLIVIVVEFSPLNRKKQLILEIPPFLINLLVQVLHVKGQLSMTLDPSA